MKAKQSILNNFYKRKGKGSSDESDDSGADQESVYVPSKSKRMYEQPMAWTRVKEVHLAATQRLTIWDVEQDILADKRLKQVRSVAVRDPRELLFDPESFREMSEELTIARHTLSREQLLEYGKVATRIRHLISHKHDSPKEEIKGEQAEQVGFPEQDEQLRALFTCKLTQDDIEEKSN